VQALHLFELLQEVTGGLSIETIAFQTCDDLSLFRNMLLALRDVPLSLGQVLALHRIIHATSVPIGTGPDQRVAGVWLAG
jgi:hypothetical protein